MRIDGSGRLKSAVSWPRRREPITSIRSTDW
jgi:hypothetical protein